MTLLGVFLTFLSFFFLHRHQFKERVLDKILFLFLKHTVLDLLFLLFEFEFYLPSDVQITHPLVNLLCLCIDRETHGFREWLNTLTVRLLVLSSVVLKWGLISRGVLILTIVTDGAWGDFHIEIFKVVGNGSGGGLVKGFDWGEGHGVWRVDLYFSN